MVGPVGRKMDKKMIYNFFFTLTLFLLLVILLTYMLWMPGESFTKLRPVLAAEEIQLKRQLQNDIYHLTVTIGPRHVGKPEKLRQAQQWITSNFANDGYQPTTESFTTNGVEVANIIAEIKGSREADKIIVVGAHYDSVHINNCPGANDNGSGVVAMLALAKALRPLQPTKTIRFIAYVNEEPPYTYTQHMGSLVNARESKKNKDNIVAMFSLETLGYYTNKPNSQAHPYPLSLFYPHEGNFIAFIGNLSSASLVRKSLLAFREQAELPSEGAALPFFIRGVSWSDHWSYWHYGYPAIMITDTAFYRYPFYHTAEDTHDKLNYVAFTRAVMGLEHMLIKLSQ